jgi:hypothetical protein
LQALIQELRAQLGADQVLTEGDLSAWEQDWRKRDRGRALAVVRPGSTAAVARPQKTSRSSGSTTVGVTYARFFSSKGCRARRRLPDSSIRA